MKALEVNPGGLPIPTQGSFYYMMLPLFTSFFSPHNCEYRLAIYVWGLRFPKSVYALKIVCLHMYTFLWKEIMAANRGTVQVKRDNINVKAPSIQQGLWKCDWACM